jgi:thiamine kinase-like enzyme
MEWANQEAMACRGMLMKAMINRHGDDSYQNRLFSYFQTQFEEKILQMQPIRKWVFLMRTEKDTYVLKGYSRSKLKLQEAFTDTLRKEGFLNTYQFVTPNAKEQLYFEGTYFGCTRYIQHNQAAFSFHAHKNRQEGIDLLQQFHKVTHTFESRYRTLLPKGKIIDKWQERQTIFANNYPVLKFYLSKSSIQEMLSWAKWSLEGMEKNQSYFINEPYVILHGDVAHHNFLRDTKGKLYLIDFDLVNIGPATLDFLQYANRILPSIEWSFEKLKKYSVYRVYLRDEAFLYALAFPADIFREWNRAVREYSYSDHPKMQQLLDLTIGQFHERRKFVEQLKRKITQ